MGITTLTREQMQPLLDTYNENGLEAVFYLSFKKLRPKSCKRALKSVCHKHGIRYGHVFDESDEWDNFVINGDSNQFWEDAISALFARLGITTAGGKAVFMED